MPRQTFNSGAWDKLLHINNFQNHEISLSILSPPARAGAFRAHFVALYLYTPTCVTSTQSGEHSFTIWYKLLLSSLWESLGLSVELTLIMISWKCEELQSFEQPGTMLGVDDVICVLFNCEVMRLVIENLSGGPSSKSSWLHLYKVSWELKKKWLQETWHTTKKLSAIRYANLWRYN